MQARYYDPLIGRFMAEDPMNMLTMEMNPGYFNRYAYTFNDPVNLIDPDGEASVLAVCIGPQATACALAAAGVASAGCIASSTCRDAVKQVVTLPTTKLPPRASSPTRTRARPSSKNSSKNSNDSTAAEPSNINDLMESVIGPVATPLPGETPHEFTERITRECRQSCIDQAVSETEDGEDEMPPVGGGISDKIGQCTHKCVDQIIE